MKDWGNCWWVGNNMPQKHALLVQSKRSFCVWEIRHAQEKSLCQDPRTAPNPFPNFTLTIHSFSLPPFESFSEPHRLTPAASTHQTLIPQLSASSLADLTGKWSFGLGSDAAVIRAMEIPSVKINSIAPAFSILGNRSHHIQSFSLVLPSLSP